MKLNFPTLILMVTIFLVPCITSSCNQTCGAGEFPFPFGFSAACPIPLNCSVNGTAVAADFPVRSITGDTIIINLPAMCGRPLEALRRLFAPNYAPSSLNTILLRNCSGAKTAVCVIPMATLKDSFNFIDCGTEKNDSISCYSQSPDETSFIDYENLTRSGCGSLFSGISVMNSSPASLDFQMMRMGWWLIGECRCSENAKCVVVSPPAKGNLSGYRCQCQQGFTGDGFRDGLGCRRGRVIYGVLSLSFFDQ